VRYREDSGEAINHRVQEWYPAVGYSRSHLDPRAAYVHIFRGTLTSVAETRTLLVGKVLRLVMARPALEIVSTVGL
jgi:hypothetical protein